MKEVELGEDIRVSISKRKYIGEYIL